MSVIVLKTNERLNDAQLRTESPSAPGSRAFDAGDLGWLLQPATWVSSKAVAAKCTEPAHAHGALFALLCRSRASKTFVQTPLCGREVAMSAPARSMNSAEVQSQMKLSVISNDLARRMPSTLRAMIG